jgi:hypothetical protein
VGPGWQRLRKKREEGQLGRRRRGGLGCWAAQGALDRWRKKREVGLLG